jgi:hypothetical protein
VVAEAEADATGTEAGGDAPALVNARVQALLIGALRLVLAVVALALARVRGVDPGQAGLLFALGGGLLLIALPASVTRRAGRRRAAEAQPLPDGAAVIPHRRALALAMYPSTIGLSAVTVVALAVKPELAAVLAGILAGLGLAALYSAAQLVLWERELGGHLYLERGRVGRIFLARRLSA